MENGSSGFNIGQKIGQFKLPLWFLKHLTITRERREWMMFVLGVLIGMGVAAVGFALLVAWVNKNPPNFLPW